MSKVTKAIFLVAGLGTRFLPATKAQPKEMLPILDKPVIQLLVEEAVASGIKEVIFVTGKGKRALEDHFDYAIELEYYLGKKGKQEEIRKTREISNLAKFTYVRQREPRGDGDALLSAAHLIGNEPVAIFFGDDLVVSKIPCLKQLIKVYEKYQDPVIAVVAVPKKKVSHYGVIGGVKVEDRVFQMKEIIEKPTPDKAPSNLAVIGKYIITPDIIKSLKQSKPYKNEIILANAFKHYLSKKRVCYGYQFEGIRYDCGTKIGMLKATVAYGLKHPETKNEFKKYLKTLKTNI